VKNLIEALDKKGFIIGLGTSNSFELAEKSLKHNGIWHFFRTAVTGDEHLKGKPFPDIYLLAAQRLQLEPRDCLVIEDTLTGVQAGKAAGMTVFAIYDADSLEYIKQIKQTADRFYADYHQMAEELLAELEG
jgi:HAD superfamily hydrolase (TIGR01509 family)